MLRATPKGEGMPRAWLDTPVTHFREVRVELMLKLALIDRAGGDCRPLLRRQLDRFRDVMASLERTNGDEPSGFDWLLKRWRAESARATMGWLELALDAPEWSPATGSAAP
jgi:hypothetical protein